MTRWLLILALLVLSAVSVMAANDGGTVSPFAFGAGARELSLGSASWTAPSDAVAAYWNPARLARTERTAVTGFYTRLFDSDVAYQYAGVAIPTLDWGSFGVGVFRLGIDGIEQRDASNLLLGETSDNRMALYLAYGRQLSGFDVGLSVQMEQHSMDNYSATSSPGLNLAAVKTIMTGSQRITQLDLAVQLRNIIRPAMKLDQEDVHLPTQVAFGVSASIQPNQALNQKATIFAGVDKTDQVSSRLSFGIEYAFLDMLSLRGGINDDKLTVGGGVAYRSISFDYSLVQRDLGSVHMFSLTSEFGSPASIRRESRTQKREQEFNELMNDRLQQRNIGMIDDLIHQGKQMLTDGDLTGAEGALDRALFLSRSSDLDTIEVATLLTDCRTRLVDVQRKHRYSLAMDSAQVRMEASDYLGVRYFANQALVEQPNSFEARELLSKANSAIQLSLAREEAISAKLWVVDSLLSYGKVDQAASVASALSEYAPHDHSVSLALKKVRFEQFRQLATNEYSRGNLRPALQAIDSALALFAGHSYCLDLRKQIVASIKTSAEKTASEMAKTEIKPAALSPELMREVESDYETGQKLFKAGDLKQAIQYWEKVELLQPDYQSVRTYLVNGYKYVGVELYGQNKLKEAVSIWKKAERLQPDNQEIADYIKRTENEISKIQELSYGFER